MMRDIGDDARAEMLSHIAGFVRDFRLVGKPDDVIRQELPAMLAGSFEGEGRDPRTLEIVAVEIRRAVERALETPAHFTAADRREFKDRTRARFGGFFDDLIPEA
jgi:hypothetical protein